MFVADTISRANLVKILFYKDTVKIFFYKDTVKILYYKDTVKVLFTFKDSELFRFA